MTEQGVEFQVHEQLARDCITVGDLPLCRVLLMNDSNYPWFVLVPRRAGLREVYELSAEDQAMFWRESGVFARLLMARFEGHKFNLAALGNVVPQLHVHHVVRRTDDKAWPRPIWGVLPMQAYADSAARTLVAEIRGLLETNDLLLKA